GSGDGEFIRPQGLAIDSECNVYVSEYGNDRIQVFDPQGRFLRKWGSEGNGDGEFSQPQGLAIDSEGDVYVSDQGNHRILVFKPTV
ncbi:MAG: 6-bladed beta-propeller, partial [Chloroflexota bacterium]|nr:6-bladed beta-propeller [Chloroflexota bacterium]